jgi:hypothetical protein
MRITSTLLAALPVLAGSMWLAAAASADGAPTDKAAPAIMISGEGATARRFDIAALAKLPQQTVRAEAHGHTANCTGPNLIDVVAAVGAPSGEKLRGKNLSLYVRVSAADGYRAVFALAELDPAMRDAVPILSASCDGAPLDAKGGPFRIVVPGEKRPARWVRQVISIDVIAAP